MQLTLNERRHLANAILEKINLGSWRQHRLDFIVGHYGDKPNKIVIGPGKSPPPDWLEKVTIVNKYYLWGYLPEEQDINRGIVFQLYQDRYDFWVMSKTDEEEEVWEAIMLNPDLSVFRPYSYRDKKSYRVRERYKDSTALVESMMMKLVNECEAYVYHEEAWQHVDMAENPEPDYISLQMFKKAVS